MVRLEYILLLKSPIILSGNSLLILKIILKYFLEQFLELQKYKGYSSTAEKITSFKHLYTVALGC